LDLVEWREWREWRGAVCGNWSNEGT